MVFDDHVKFNLWHIYSHEYTWCMYIRGPCTRSYSLTLQVSTVKHYPWALWIIHPLFHIYSWNLNQPSASFKFLYIITYLSPHRALLHSDFTISTVAWLSAILDSDVQILYCSSHSTAHLLWTYCTQCTSLSFYRLVNCPVVGFTKPFKMFFCILAASIKPLNHHHRQALKHCIPLRSLESSNSIFVY